MGSRTDLVRQIARTLRDLDPQLGELRASSQESMSRMESVAVDLDRIASQVTSLAAALAALSSELDEVRDASRTMQADILMNLMQYQRDNWEAANSRHEFTVALLEGLRQAPPSTGPDDQRDEFNERDAWFHDHFDTAAAEVVDFLAEEGIELSGRDVADVGCGDGIIDLGIVSRGGPRSFVGYDIKPTDRSELAALAERELGIADLPSELVFELCQPDRLPADDDTFDVVVSWSAFEHVADPVVVAKEIHRVLRASGALFIQLWPFYSSEYGSHLDEWFPDGYAWINGFHHLTHSPAEIETQLKTRETGDARLEKKLNEYRTLNRITIDELQEALLVAGFEICKVKLLSHTVTLPRGLATQHRLANLAIGGIELLAVPSAQNVGRP